MEILDLLRCSVLCITVLHLAVGPLRAQDDQKSSSVEDTAEPKQPSNRLLLEEDIKDLRKRVDSLSSDTAAFQRFADETLRGFKDVTPVTLSTSESDLKTARSAVEALTSPSSPTPKGAEDVGPLARVVQKVLQPAIDAVRLSRSVPRRRRVTAVAVSALESPRGSTLSSAMNAAYQIHETAIEKFRSSNRIVEAAYTTYLSPFNFESPDGEGGPELKESFIDACKEFFGPKHEQQLSALARGASEAVDTCKVQTEGSLTTAATTIAKEHESAKADLNRKVRELEAVLQKENASRVDLDQRLIYCIWAMIATVVVLFLGLKFLDRDVAIALVEKRSLIEVVGTAFVLITIIILGTGRKVSAEILGTLLGTISGYIFGRGNEREADSGGRNSSTPSAAPLRQSHSSPPLASEAPETGRAP